MPTKNRSKDTTSRGFETKEPNWYPLRRLSLVSFQAPTDKALPLDSLLATSEQFADSQTCSHTYSEDPTS